MPKMLSFFSLISSLANRRAVLSLRDHCRHFLFHGFHIDKSATSDGNENGLHWWQRLEESFETLLEAAGYTETATSRHLQSFSTIAAPYFAGQTRTRSSFMTDNGSPVEFSWDWGWDGCSPSVRYSVEPLFTSRERNSTTTMREAAGLQFVTELSAKFDVPLDVFHYFWHGLVLPSAATAEHTTGTAADDLSQFFAGFDFDNDKFMLKGYFLPTLRAQSEERPRYDVIKSALTQSPGWSAFTVSFATVDDFIRNSSLRSQLDAEIFSLDITNASPSRYKLYVRCRATTFASVREVVSLGGRLSSPALEQSLVRLRQLWAELFQVDAMDEELALPTNLHRTAGILYYFEMCAGKPVSTPKIYLPVRHYAPNDAQVSRVVNGFVVEQAKAAGADASQPVSCFNAALDKMSQERPLEVSRGLHTYIGCTLERGSLKLISYLNPSVAYFKGRDF